MRIDIRGRGSCAASSRTAPSPITWPRPTTGSRASIAARHLRGQPDHGARLHRRRHHLHDRQLHNSRSAAHSDAAVQALIDSGIRGVHASGAPQTGEWDRQWPQDLERLQKQFVASTDSIAPRQTCRTAWTTRVLLSLGSQLGVLPPAEPGHGASLADRQPSRAQQSDATDQRSRSLATRPLSSAQSRPCDVSRAWTSNLFEIVDEPRRPPFRRWLALRPGAFTIRAQGARPRRDDRARFPVPCSLVFPPRSLRWRAS